MKRICVFCGSNTGNDPVYIEQAKQLGSTLAQQNIQLVYGGSSIGLMGAIADATLAACGKVTGIITQALLDKKTAHSGLTELTVVQTMHERKSMMFNNADGFIALPGGLGTFEELFEILTWAQLGDHTKPCAVLNINGFYNKLIEFLDHSTDQQFMKPEHRNLLITGTEPNELLQKMRDYKAPQVSKWFKAP